MLYVTQVTEADGELVAAVVRLLPQLSTSADPPTVEDLAEIVRSPSTVFFVLRDGTPTEGDVPEGSPTPDGVTPARTADPIVGTLTLAVFRIPTGIRAWIEDVIVDEAVRGQGGGEKLTRAALDKAREMGARTVELTSRPTRQAANRLYQRLGFVTRQTNIYRYELRRD